MGWSHYFLRSSRCRVKDKSGTPAQVKAYILLKDRSSANQEVTRLNNTIGKSLMLESIEGVNTIRVNWRYSVELVDADSAAPKLVNDSHLGQVYRVNLILTVERLC